MDIALGTKVLHVHVIVIFQNHANIKNLKRSPDEYTSMLFEMLKFATKLEESPLIFGTHKSSFLSDQHQWNMWLTSIVILNIKHHNHIKNCILNE